MRINLKQIYILSLGLYFIALPLGAIDIGIFGSALKILAIIPFGLSIFNIKSFKKNNCLTYYFIYVCLAFISVFYAIKFL